MAGLIPRPFIDELLNKTDIVELIDAYVPLKKRGNSHIACCPFHHEKTPSFNVVAKKQFYHCFGCAASGNAISFIMNYLHLSFVDAVENLASRLGMHVPRDGKSEKNDPPVTLYQLMEKVSFFYQQTLKQDGQAAIDYLKQRQISGDVARLYQLGYAPAGWQTLELKFKRQKDELIVAGMLVPKEHGQPYDRYRHRIMFPIHDRNGRIVGFGGRAIDASQKPKYLNSPETVIFQKNRELYGLYQAIQQNSSLNEVIVVEGYMDVIALAQHGISYAVATLGTATSVYHIQLLSKFTKRLVFCFDGDNAGRQAAWRALESTLPHLNNGIEASFTFLPENHDPDSLIRHEGRDQFLERIHNAIPLHQFFFTTIGKDHDLSSFAGKSLLVNQAKPFLEKIPNGSYKELMLDELARRSRIESHRIHQLLSENKTGSTETVNVNIARSPIRLAIAILLQHPEIYANHASTIHSHWSQSPKQDLLQQLMRLIDTSPRINTAGLIEYWRESPLFESLNKLASWDHQVPEGALAKEFLDIMLFLSKKNLEDKIQQLLKKARDEGLTETDRLQLQDMLKRRHRNFNTIIDNAESNSRH